MLLRYMKMNNRGYTIVLDAIVALALTVIVFGALYGISYKAHSPTASIRYLHHLSEDVLDSLNKRNILDAVGEEWAYAAGNASSVHWENATNISTEYLEKLIPPHIGYRLTIDDQIIAENTSRTNESTSHSKTHATRLLVGYSAEKPTRGYVARAFLSEIVSRTTSTYTYFGGFEGEGNITHYITLPETLDSVIRVYVELNAGSDFDLIVNGADTGCCIRSGGEFMSANVKEYIANPENFFDPGLNTVEVRFLGADLSRQYIGGGFIRVTYNTSEIEPTTVPQSERHYFPGIQGLINYYSSIYAPGTLTSVNIHLRYLANYTTYLTVGDTIVYNASANETEQIVDIPDSQLSGLLDYNLLSSKTTPVRLGLSDISIVSGEGTGDIILTTDLSFSMWQDRCMEGSWHTVYDRDDPILNDTTEAEHVCTNECIRNDGQLCHYPDYWYGHPECASCRYGCWRSHGCGVNDGSACTLPCYECIWYGDAADPPSGRADGGSYCYDCTNLGCIWCFELNEVEEWCAVNCGPNVYAYFGVNGTSSDPYAPAPPGYCSLYLCSGSDRSSCWYGGQHTCDQAYVHQHTTYAGDGLPIIYHLPCPNKCFACNLTGIGLAKQLDRTFIERILNTSGNGIGLIGYGDATYSFHYLSNDTSSLTTQVEGYYGGGETCVCCALDDAISLLTSANETRRKFIVAMTDGETNVRCYNALSDLDGDSQLTAKDDAIQYACDAQQIHNTTVYSIGFGSDAGVDTLQRIADCGGGSFYASDSMEELEQIYDDIAHEIINASYVAQIVNATDIDVNTTLYPDSYIEVGFSYQPNQTYGDIPLSMNSERFDDTENCSGVIELPEHVGVSDMKVTSYSSEYWTDYVSVDYGGGEQVAYSLRDGSWGDNYSILGDPYMVEIPVELISVGRNNTIKVETGLDSTTPMGCSADNTAIYTIHLDRTIEYGDVFARQDGCVWVIEFEDGTNITKTVPEGSVTSKTCLYTQGNISYGTDDSIDDAVYRLLMQLDWDHDGMVNVILDPDEITFDLGRAGGVQSLWGPIRVKLILWT